MIVTGIMLKRCLCVRWLVTGTDKEPKHGLSPAGSTNARMWLCCRYVTRSEDCFYSTNKRVNLSITEERRRKTFFFLKESWFSSSSSKRYEECITLFGLTLVACDNTVFFKNNMYVFFVCLYLKYVEITEGCFLSCVLWEVSMFFHSTVTTARY